MDYYNHTFYYSNKASMELQSSSPYPLPIGVPKLRFPTVIQTGNRPLIKPPQTSTSANTAITLGNFSTYPDFSTVTLPVRNNSESRRLPWISVNLSSRVPNSLGVTSEEERGVYGDDQFELLQQCAWCKNLVRIATIGDGSCFFHAALKAGDPEYQINNSYKFRTQKAYMLRRDLAYLLTLPDPRYPTENVARVMLWQAFKLDSDESLINYLKSTKMMTFPEPPQIPRVPKPKTSTDKANNVDAVIQWTRYERERKIWEDQNYPLAREYATTHANEILDIRKFLGDATLTLQMNSYYFTLREGHLAQLAIEKKNQTMDDFPDLYELIAILINPARYVGDTDVIGWFAEVVGVNICFCEVYNDKVVCSRIVKSETARFAILMNNTGNGYHRHESVHFETIGLKTFVGTTEYIQTIFPLNDPLLKAFEEEMQKSNPAFAGYESVKEFIPTLTSPIIKEGSHALTTAEPNLLINIPIPTLPDARTLPASPKSRGSTNVSLESTMRDLSLQNKKPPRVRVPTISKVRNI
jgi:hypothetical protein